MELNIKTSLAEAVMENLPAKSVEVALEDPFTWTVTLPIGLLPSVTVPDTDWEKLANEKNNAESKSNNLLADAEICLVFFLI